jgi:hypothetical protein
MIRRKICDTAGSISSYHSSKRPIIAVKPLFRRKVVFCIDNVIPCITVNETSDFIANDLSVEASSIFEAKARRLMNNSNFADRKAFRVCINKHDVGRLLVPDLWTRDSAISEWYFKWEVSDAAGVNTNADTNETNGKASSAAERVTCSQATVQFHQLGIVPFTSTCLTTDYVQSSLSPK